MFRVGILGSENSHAMAFSKYFNGIDKTYLGEFDDIEVVGTFSRYPEANEALQKEAGVPYIAERPEDLLGKVDAVMVTARDGRYHAAYARPFIEAGIPAFIDKPLTSDGEEAIELVRLAKKKGVPLVGGSSLKLCEGTKQMAALVRREPEKVIGGSIYAPVKMVNDYGGFYFYSSHLAEISLSVFGYDPEWVMASQTKHGVGVLVHYKDYDVSNHFSQDMGQYGGTVITTDGPTTTQISMDCAYAEECRSFARMLRAGKMDFTYEQLAMPVVYLNAIDKSMQTGQPVAVEKIVL